ncbi:MAG: ribonuclease HII [Bacteroidetes bacterium]|nr:ribonuclease HII [Bacteroidota bacterium]
MLTFEQQLWAEGFSRVMGLDEVGRGCLAGPVVAAGVILKPNTTIEGVRDSKKLSASERLRLSQLIKEKAAYWTIQVGDVVLIDKINILWASLETMHACALQVEAKPEYLLIDGNRFVTTLLPHQCIVKGDDKSLSIAAASILAKVYRDQIMNELHGHYPEFGWSKNVGYPTEEHKDALLNFGFTEHHRKSFNLSTDKPYSK